MVIAKIRLTLHNPRWYDDENDIYLNSPEDREEVLDTFDLDPIRKAIKFGLIEVCEGEVPPEEMECGCESGGNISQAEINAMVKKALEEILGSKIIAVFKED